MATGITVTLTHTGLSQSPILIDDLRAGGDGNTAGRQEGYYVPVGGTLELSFGGFVPISFERGDIFRFMQLGHITASFNFGGRAQLASDGAVTILTVAGAPTPDTYTGTINDSLFLVDTTNDAVTLTLPTGATHLRGRFLVTDIGGNAATNNIIITAAGGDTIAGGASYTLSTNNGQVEFVWGSASDWFLPSGLGGVPTGPAGGDLAGTYPNPTVVPVSLTVAGKIELATQAETDTGTDALRAVAPLTLASATTVEHPKFATFTVAKSGGQYTTIEAGVAAANINALAGNPSVVLVSPGIYTENNPITIGPSVSLTAEGRHEVTEMLCANPAGHGFVLSSYCEIIGLLVDGASGAGAAGFHFPLGVEDCELHDTMIRDCDIGYWSESGVGLNPGIMIKDPHVFSGTCTSVFKATGGGQLQVWNATQRDSAIVTNWIHSDGVGSRITVYGADLRGDNTTNAVLVENLGVARVIGCRLDRMVNGFNIAATGGSITSSGTVITATTWDLLLADTVNAFCDIAACIADTSKFNVGANATLLGVFQDDNVADPGPTTLGEMWLGATITERVPLGTYTRQTASSAWVSGGLVTINAGFVLDVAPGAGFINTGTGVRYVTWTAQQVTATADSDFYVYINSSGVAQIATTEPSLETNLILSVGRTNATAIVFLARSVVPGKQIAVERHEWIKSITGSLWVSGLLTTELASPSLQFTVSAGTFYQTSVLLTALASASPCSFNYWYRDGAGWDVTVGATSLDDANYDPAGAGLVAIPAGNWVKCAVYVCANDGITAWHVVYPQTSFAIQADAENGVLPVPPNVFVENTLPLGAFIIQQGSGDITSILDIRPVIATAGPGSALAPATHGALAGLAADGHGQYLLLAGNAARNPLTGILNAAGGGLILPTGAAPSQTTEGQVVWDSDDDLLTVGDGVARKTMVDLTTAQNLTNKTLVTPTIASMVNATHDHADAAGGGLVVQATETLRGAAEIATQAEVDTGTDDLRFVTPLKLASASSVILNGQAAGGGLGGTYPNPSVTPAAGLDTTAVHSGDAAGGDLAGTYPNPTVVAASEGAAGKIEIATQAEVTTGTDDTRAVTPLKLAQALGVSAFTEITVDTTTAATVGTPAVLLTINITPKSASSIFLVHFTACGDTDSAGDQQLSFSVWYGLTGAETRRRSTRIFHDALGDESGACSIVQRFVALGAGQHTIQIRWGRTGGTARIRPVANSNYDHAALLVQEVTH